MMLRLLSLLAFCNPALAQEGCPTAADLDAGVRLTYPDGRIEVVRRSAQPHILEIEGAEPVNESYSRNRYRVELAHGTYFLSGVEQVAGSSEWILASVTDYGRPSETLPQPKAEAQVSLEATSTDTSGSTEVSPVYSFGDLHAVRLGGCVYEAFDISVYYDSADDLVESGVFLPAVGTWILTRRGNETEGETWPLPSIDVIPQDDSPDLSGHLTGRLNQDRSGPVLRIPGR